MFNLYRTPKTLSTCACAAAATAAAAAAPLAFHSTILFFSIISLFSCSYCDAMNSHTDTVIDRLWCVRVRVLQRVLVLLTDRLVYTFCLWSSCTHTQPHTNAFNISTNVWLVLRKLIRIYSLIFSYRIERLPILCVIIIHFLSSLPQTQTAQPA